MRQSETRCIVGWLIDGSGGPIGKDVCLGIRDGRIRHVRKTENSDWHHPGAVDLSGYTIFPNLVDSHVHLFMSGSEDPRIREQQLVSEYTAVREVIAAHLKFHAECGVMAVRDGGDRSGHSSRFAAESGSSLARGVIMRTAGNAWRQTGRYGTLIGRTPPKGMMLAEAIRSEDRNVDHIKIVNSGLNSLTVFGKTTPPQFTQTEMKMAVSAAADRGLPVMVHANGSTPVEIAVEAGCRSIEHGFFMGTENLVKLVERGVFWVPTAVAMKAYSELLDTGEPGREGALRNLDHQLEQIRQARRIGVRIAAGSDAGSLGVHHGPGVIEEMKLLMEADFSLAEAVQCSAANGAALLSLEKSGTLESGQVADFIAVKGSPAGLLDQLRQGADVWSKGAPVL